VGGAVIEVGLDRPSYRAGEAVTGRVRVTVGGRARSVEAFVTYAERTRDFTHALVYLRSGPLVLGDLQPGWELPFSIVLPPSVYPNVDSPYGSISWELDVKVDVPSATDVHAVRRLEVEYSSLAAAEVTTPP
jgi:hypothetical protein